MDGSVAIPLSWFLTSIGGLCTVIAVLAKTIFNIQNQRIEDKAADAEKIMTALNNNTNVLNTLKVDR